MGTQGSPAAPPAKKEERQHRHDRRDAVLLAIGIIFGILGNITADFIFGFFSSEAIFWMSLPATIATLIFVYLILFKDVGIRLT